MSLLNQIRLSINFLGYENSELSNELYRYYKPRFKKSFKEDFKRGRRYRKYLNLEKIFIRKDGTPIHLELSWVFIRS